MSNAQRRGVGSAEVRNRASGAPALARWRGTAWALILASAAGGDARAQDLAADSTPAELEAAEPEELVVTGRRVSEASAAIGTDHSTSTVAITREALESAPAGVSGLKMLESLPGFNVQANDALGLYEFGNSVSVRAFNMQQIGFVLDGIPMGRSDQFGGSPIYRYVDNEDLARVTASPGAGDVALPSYVSLGPMVSYDTLAPAPMFGAQLSQSLGSDNLQRNFMRIDTGEYRGWSGTASRSHVAGDVWRGPGDYEREHLEGKIRYRFSSGADLTFKAVYTDYDDFDSPSITLAQYNGSADDYFGRSGRRFAYLGTVPNLPPTVEGVPYSNPQHNQYYQQAINSRTDALYGLRLQAPVNSWLNTSATAYYEDKEGFGVSPEAYATSLANYQAEAAIIPGLNAPLGLQYGLSTIDGDRKGVTARADAALGLHALSATVWYEDDRYHRTQARYNMEGGNPAGAPLLDQPVHLQKDFESERKTLQLALKDTIGFSDERFNLDFGVKLLSVDYSIDGYRNPGDYINQRQPSVSETYEDYFLPQIGLVYRIDSRNQIFASYSENMAFPRGADDVFAAASPAAPAQAPSARKTSSLAFAATTVPSMLRWPATSRASTTVCSRSRRRFPAAPPTKHSSRMSARSTPMAWSRAVSGSRSCWADTSTSMPTSPITSRSSRMTTRASIFQAMTCPISRAGSCSPGSPPSRPLGHW